MAKEKNIPPFGNEEANPYKQFNQFKLPGGGLETLVMSYQKNMDLLTTNQKLAVESAKSIFDLQRAYFKRRYDIIINKKWSGMSEESF